jgi:hypothetical protein
MKVEFLFFSQAERRNKHRVFNLTESKFVCALSKDARILLSCRIKARTLPNRTISCVIATCHGAGQFRFLLTIEIPVDASHASRLNIKKFHILPTRVTRTAVKTKRYYFTPK